MSELIAIPMPGGLLAHVIAASSEKAFRSLSHISIAGLLRSEVDAVRKVTALKCIKVFPKKWVAKALASYISADQQRYYNVVHWLDLGVSAPMNRAREAAEHVITLNWRAH